MQVWNLLHVACWKCTNKSLNLRLCTIVQLCRAISSQLGHMSTIRKNVLNSNISSICPHNMVNFGPLVAEIFRRVWGTPADFNGFRILASLLQLYHSTEVNETLHDVWPSAGLVHYIYIFGGSCPLTEFCHATPVGISQMLRHGTRNGITELLQMVPPIYGWAAITLGIGPHF